MRLYRATLYFFISLFVLAVLLALYDVLQQLLFSPDSGSIGARIYNGITAATTFVLVGILAAFISISRLITVRRSLASIPKSYVPISSGDLPRPIYRLISSEYSRAALISYVARPTDRSLKGLSSSSTLSPSNTDTAEIIHFRSAIISTSDALAELLSADDSLATPIAVRLSAALPAAFEPLINLYARLLDDALYGFNEPSEKDYTDTVRLFGVLAAGLSPH